MNKINIINTTNTISTTNKTKTGKKGGMPYNSQNSVCALYRALSKASFCSRSEAKSLVLEGRVEVNGVVAINLMQPVNFKKDRIEVDGKRIKKISSQYLAFNKPGGCETTVPKTANIKGTVYEFMPFALDKKAYPVGRLDKDSRGLIILTNDNDFINCISGDKTRTAKCYTVKVSRELTDEEFEEFKLGVSIKVDGRIAQTGPCIIKRSGENHYDIKLNQGMNRQIRKMFEHFGVSVLDLFRYKIGNLDIRRLKLKEGEFVNILPEDVIGEKDSEKPVRKDDKKNAKPAGRPFFKKN